MNFSVETPKLTIDKESWRREILRGLDEAAALVNNEFKAVSPQGGTKELVNSWTREPAHSVGNGMEASVKSPLIQAWVVDGGAKDHFPPYGDKEGKPIALRQWIVRQLGLTAESDIRRMAFLIGRKFAQQGIKARYIFRKAFERMKPNIESCLNAALDRAGKAAQK